jgi:hypothetical protein
MTINEMIETLKAIVAEDEYRADMRVTFGENVIDVENWRVGWDRHNLAVLNLVGPGERAPSRT